MLPRQTTTFFSTNAFSFCSFPCCQLSKQVYHVCIEWGCILFCWLPRQTQYKRIPQSIPCLDESPGTQELILKSTIRSQPLWYLKGKSQFPPKDIIQRRHSEWLREKTSALPPLHTGWNTHGDIKVSQSLEAFKKYLDIVLRDLIKWEILVIGRWLTGWS